MYSNIRVDLELHGFKMSSHFKRLHEEWSSAFRAHMGLWGQSPHLVKSHQRLGGNWLLRGKEIRSLRCWYIRGKCNNIQKFRSTQNKIFTKLNWLRSIYSNHEQLAKVETSAVLLFAGWWTLSTQDALPFMVFWEIIRFIKSLRPVA